MDPRAERVVEFLGSVRGQEQDALEPLEAAQGDGHKCIACDVVASPLGQEDVRFIEYDNGIPGFGGVENVLQFRVGIFGVGAEIA